MNFSPKKLRISTTVLFSEVTQLMGKWAYTVRFVLESLGDSTDHVRNVRADSSDGSNFLL